MIYTNKHDLPPIVVRAILNEQKIHRPIDGQIGVTTLMNSPLIFRLMQQHWDEIKMDVSDLMWAFEGSAIHALLDRTAKQGQIVDTDNGEFKVHHYQTEKWVSGEIDGWKVRGVIDVYDVDNEAIEDYKRTSAWSFVYADRSMDSWEKQLNIYRYLLMQQGYPVKELYINGFLRDWTASKVGSGHYPNANFQRIKIKTWSLKKTEEYLHERIRLFKESAKNLTGCTPDERWRSGGKFALMLPGRKTAKKLFDTEEELEKWAYNMGIEKYKIEQRAIEDRKCKTYCPVAQFCPFNIYNKEVKND